MTDSVPIIIAQCELEDGYILKNFFGFNSLRGRPVITFLPDKISADNCTADHKIHGSSYLHGDEIGLIWNQQIPFNNRKLNLTFNSDENLTAFGRIKKKDEAKIIIAQYNKENYFDFDGPNSSNDFIIYISCGGGGDRREGVQSVAATRVIDPERTLIRQPDPKNSHLLVIPIKTFRQMVDSFSKCKKMSIRVCFYVNGSEEEYCNTPGIIITTDMLGSSKSRTILEKYGGVPEDTGNSTPGMNIILNNLNFDETSIVRTNSLGPRLILEKELEPNEFVFDADKIFIFTRLASMHNEGNVRIYYQSGCHLRIANRFGGFGECELNLHNNYVKYSKNNL